MEKKNVYTQKQFYEEVMEAMADNANAVAMCKKKLEQLANKTSTVDAKKTAEQREVMDRIITVLCASNSAIGMKCGEIVKALNAEYDEEYSSSKVNAMLRKLLPPDDKNPTGTGEVVRAQDKKDVYFRLA